MLIGGLYWGGLQREGKEKGHHYDDHCHHHEESEFRKKGGQKTQQKREGLASQVKSPRRKVPSRKQNALQLMSGKGTGAPSAFWFHFSAGVCWCLDLCNLPRALRVSPLVLYKTLPRRGNPQPQRSPNPETREEPKTQH